SSRDWSSDVCSSDLPCRCSIRTTQTAPNFALLPETSFTQQAPTTWPAGTPKATSTCPCATAPYRLTVLPSSIMASCARCSNEFAARLVGQRPGRPPADHAARHGLNRQRLAAPTGTFWRTAPYCGLDHAGLCQFARPGIAWLGRPGQLAAQPA